MIVRDAKDFLVDQAAQQAAIDGVPLADLEKRMMHFTEWDDSGGDHGPSKWQPLGAGSSFNASASVQVQGHSVPFLKRAAYT
jgi:hypothetical protein